MATPTDLHVTVHLADGVEILIREWAESGTVEADVRGTGVGRTWMPVTLTGGSLTVERLPAHPTFDGDAA